MMGRNFIRICLVAFASAIANQVFSQKVLKLNYTIPVDVPIQVKLDTINAVFYQIPDTIITSATGVHPGHYFIGNFRNKFTTQNGVNISYIIRSNKYGGRTIMSTVLETNRLLSSIDSSNVRLRDSIVDSEYKRHVNFAKGKNKINDSTSCFPEDQIFQEVCQNKKKHFNADSVVLIQRVTPPSGSCAFGLLKELLIYKKNLGYIVLQYSLVHSNDRRISFSEASALIDTAVQQTWGMIRFKEETD
jgi:hypothetical protein